MKLVSLLLAAAALATASAGAAPAEPVRGAYGVNAWPLYPVERGVERTAELTSAAGIRWTRLLLPWARIEPTRGRFDWRFTDRYVRTFRRERVQILGNLAYGTNWNTTAPPEVTRIAEREHYPPADYSLWARYVRETVKRYKRDIRYWEVWNEPDLRFFWGGTPGQFAELLAVAAREIRKVDPKAKVLIGGLALGGSAQARDANFFREVLEDPRHPAAKSFDIANFHHYGTQETARKRMAHVRAELRRVGAGRKPVWVTEAGGGSDPERAWGPRWRGPEGQALYLRELLPYLLSLGVRKVFWFTIADDPRDRSFGSFGLADARGEPKPAYHAYRELIARAR